MNCAECQEHLVPYIEKLLDDAQAEQVAQHVKSCADCQAELKGLETLQGRLVTNGKAVAQTDLEDQVMNRIIREQSVRLKSATQASAGLRLRRLIMKSPMSKFAAAAAVVAVVVGMMWMQRTESIALADVIAKVEQIEAYLYRATTTVHDQAQGTRTTHSTVLTSNVHGIRTDSTGADAADHRDGQVVTYVLPRSKSIVLVNLTKKQYSRQKMDDATLETMMIENHDPRQMLKRLLACEYRELGTAVIDGLKVQGFETTDPAYMGDTEGSISARVWVAVDTWLPVRYEVEWEVAEGTHLSTVQDGYQWGIPVDGSEFEPDIPADFTAHETDGTQVPSFSEQGFVEALQIAADLIGRYPAALDVSTLQQLMADIAVAGAEKAASPQAAARITQQRMSKLLVLKTFSRVLAIQQAEPLYHGDVVTPADAELPLMRWKLPDGQYQVIFGDLHTETVTADILTELEAALPQ